MILQSLPSVSFIENSDVLTYIIKSLRGSLFVFIVSCLSILCNVPYIGRLASPKKSCNLNRFYHLPILNCTPSADSTVYIRKKRPKCDNSQYECVLFLTMQ